MEWIVDMRPLAFAACLAMLLLAGTLAAAQSITVGDDLYVAGDEADGVPVAGRDLFAAGPTIQVGEAVGKDAHVAGLSVRVAAATGGDVYAVGGDVRLDAPIGGDLSAFGFSVGLGSAGTVEGNARIGGRAVSIAGPVAGALVASGEAVRIDGPIGGDAWIAAGEVTFGPDARVGGILHVATTEPVNVPESVAPPDRVVEERIERTALPPQMPDWAPGWIDRVDRDWSVPGPFATSAAALLTLAFLLVVGAIALAAAPVGIEGLRARAAARPLASLGLGVLGLSALVGLIPVSAVTLIGLPLVPFVVLALILCWTLGYLLGVYLLAMTVLNGLRPDGVPHALGVRLGALAVVLLVAAVMNFVPFLGWMANLVLGFLGIGAIVLAAADRLAPPPPPTA